MIPAVECELQSHNGNFLCGVVEGFYGRPWTTKQRRKLFKRMKKMGMNTYLYAPKDDCKHRMLWRELYSVEEAEHLTGMINAAAEKEVLFVYALSPGLDISYSSTKDVLFLKRKLEQVASFGCKAYSILFDDIEVDMCEADKQIFQSFAQAQVSVTNEVYQYLEQPTTFLFCPTEYCATRAVPNVEQSEYLNTIGSKLLPGIDIMWTGDKVITKNITKESVQEIARVLQRPPVIWDNFHANDYDPSRMFLGPYDGRSPELIPYLRGVLTNPNCEFEANYIAMHTLAQWSKSNMEEVKKDVILSSSPVSSDIKLETEGDYAVAYQSYQPKQALLCALDEWLKEFLDDCDVPKMPKQVPCAPLQVVPPILPSEASDSLPLAAPSIPLAVATSIGITNINELNGLESFMQPAIGPQANSLIEPSSDSESESPVDCLLEPMDCASTPSTSPPVSAPCLTPSTESNSTAMDAEMSDGELLTIEDLALLVDMFYTPFEHGSKALEMLLDFNWLKNSCHVVTDSNKLDVPVEASFSEVVTEWREKSDKFERDVAAFQKMVYRLCSAPNKALLYDLFPYVWDMKVSLALAVTYVKWMGLGHVPLISVQHMQGSCHYTSASKTFRDVYNSGDHEPWVFRGGLQGEFKRLIPLDVVQDLVVPAVPRQPVARAHTIRPYCAHTDEQAVYQVCRKTCDDGADGTDIFPLHKDLVADKVIGAFLKYSSEYSFVIEDEGGICGYVLAALDAKEYGETLEKEWIPAMQQKYPKPEKAQGELSPAEEMICSIHSYKSYIADSILSNFPSIIHMDILQERCSEDVAKHALASAIAALKTNGSHGIYTQMHVGDRNTVERYGRMNIYELPRSSNQPDDVVFVARTI